MSDQVDEPVSDEQFFSNPQFIKNEWDGRQVDWLLQWLCGFINETSLQVGITLTVGGSLVTGTLVSHKEYFRLLSEAFSAPFAVSGSETQDAMRDKILGFHQDSDPSADPVQYIHLLNTRLHTGGDQLLPNEGTLWRGKISAVEGFILGDLKRV